MGHDLAQELGTQETCVLEFKRSAKDLGPIRKAIRALANDLKGEGGGDRLIGVRDDGTAEPGVDVSDGALLRIAGIRNEGTIVDRPSMLVEQARFRGSPSSVCVWRHPEPRRSASTESRGSVRGR